MSSVCIKKHGYDCCGCADHPDGKPWGWNAEAWMAHLDAHVSTTS